MVDYITVGIAIAMVVVVVAVVFLFYESITKAFSGPKVINGGATLTLDDDTVYIAGVADSTVTLTPGKARIGDRFSFISNINGLIISPTAPSTPGGDTISIYNLGALAGSVTVQGSIEFLMTSKNRIDLINPTSVKLNIF